MIWDRIRGRETHVEMFRRAVARGRFAQAYLFVGPDGVGKRLFARTLATCLFCQSHENEELAACGQCPSCRQMAAGTHPDYLTVGCPEGKRTLPISVFVGEPDKRGRTGLCHDLSLRPMAGDRRIAVVDDVNLMSPESANAFLKTLEEPPAYATLFLMASNIESLLPTIRSRCQLVRFAPLSPNDVSDLLLEQERVEDAKEADAIAAMCEGSLATAEQLLDPGLRKLRDALYGRMASASPDGLALAEVVTTGLDELTSNKQMQRRHAAWLVRFLVEFYRRTLRELSGDTGDAQLPEVRRFAGCLNHDDPDDVELVAALLDRAAETERQLDRVQPVPLCMEAMFDDLSRMTRSRGS